jgi:hypothetical protein
MHIRLSHILPRKPATFPTGWFQQAHFRQLGSNGAVCKHTTSMHSTHLQPVVELRHVVAAALHISQHLVSKLRGSLALLQQQTQQRQQQQQHTLLLRMQADSVDVNR